MPCIIKGQIIGFTPGQFVRMWQGLKTDVLMQKVLTDPGYECFEVFDEEPECKWGSGVYRVRKDNTLQEIKTDYDSSG